MQGTITVLQYATKILELSLFATYLVPDENRKARRFEEGLNHNIYEGVAVILQIQNFSELVHKATLIEKSTKRSTEIQE